MPVVERPSWFQTFASSTKTVTATNAESTWNISPRLTGKATSQPKPRLGSRSMPLTTRLRGSIGFSISTRS